MKIAKKLFYALIGFIFKYDDNIYDFSVDLRLVRFYRTLIENLTNVKAEDQLIAAFIEGYLPLLIGDITDKSYDFDVYISHGFDYKGYEKYDSVENTDIIAVVNFDDIYYLFKIDDDEDLIHMIKKFVKEYFNLKARFGKIDSYTGDFDWYDN